MSNNNANVKICFYLSKILEISDVVATALSRREQS